MSFHTRIKNRRAALFTSQEAFAQALEPYGIKVSWQAVQQWEKEGGTAPNRRRMPIVVAVLKTTPEWLLYGTGPEVVEGQDQPPHVVMSASGRRPKWMDAEAFKLLDLYYACDAELRSTIMAYIEDVADAAKASAASNDG